MSDAKPVVGDQAHQTLSWGDKTDIGVADGSTGLMTYDGYKWARRELPGAVYGPAPAGPEWLEWLESPPRASAFPLQPELLIFGTAGWIRTTDLLIHSQAL